MAIVRITQGTYRGLEKNGVHAFRGVPYSSPYERFGSPTRPVASNDPDAIQDATKFGPICPQLPSRLSMITGPPPPGGGPQDETKCGVLSVYTPRLETKGLEKLPVVVWIHGGAFISGGSQTPWYEGDRFARDGNVVVVTVNYRLGIFGFLFDEQRFPGSHDTKGRLPCGLEDAVAAFEWVRENIEAFGGNSKNITAFGQSAGAYIVQMLVDARPDLFEKAILQSSPAASKLSIEDARSVRQSVIDSLPAGRTLDTATPQELLYAQGQALRSHPNTLLAFCSRVDDGTTTGQHHASYIKPSKPILLGWTKDDAAAFAALRLSMKNIPPLAIDAAAFELSGPLTRKVFSGPSMSLAERWRNEGHAVTMFEHEWKPKDYMLGVVHCADLPLVFGDEEAWKASPMVRSGKWEDWDRVGRGVRRAWGKFARNGSFVGMVDGVRLIEA